MEIPSTTDLACPGLHCARRHGEVKDVPADPEAAAFIGASGVYPGGACAPVCARQRAEQDMEQGRRARPPYQQ